MSGPSPEHRAFVEAGIGVLMAIIMADGKYSQDEYAWFVRAQHQHPLFADVPADAFNPMLARVKARLQAESWRDLITEWAGAIPQQHRMTIFALAAEFATVDKEIEGKEPEVITHLWRSLGLPAEEAQRIFMARLEKM